MKLPSQAIREYQQIHLKEFGEELSEEEAEAQAQRVFALFEAIFYRHENEESKKEQTE